MTNHLIESKDYHGKSYTFAENEYIDHVSAYGVIIRGNQILMVKDSNSARWELPGGGLESGENTISALTREVLEETGLVVSGEMHFIGEFIEYYYDLASQQPWKSNRKFYRVAHTTGELLHNGNADDVVEAKYVDASDLEALNITACIKSIIIPLLK